MLLKSFQMLVCVRGAVCLNSTTASQSTSCFLLQNKQNYNHIFIYSTLYFTKALLTLPSTL